MTAKQWSLNRIFVLLVCQSIVVTSDKYDDLFNSMFRFSQHRLSVHRMDIIIDQLLKSASSKHRNDPRINEVAFWKGTSVVDLEKCNFAEFQALRSWFDKAKHLAQKMREELGSSEGRTATSHLTILNLEAYFENAVDKLMSFCSVLIPGLYNHLQDSTGDSFRDLVELTEDARHHYRISPYKVGENIAALLFKKLSQDDLEQLSRSLGYTGLVEAMYEQHTPCNRLLRAVESKRGFYDLVAESRHYRLKRLSFPCAQTESRRDNMQNWVERVRICRYISEQPPVFEIALDRMVSGDRMVKALARVGLTEDDHYDSILRFSATQMNYYEVKAALSILNSRPAGLKSKDPRRAEVSFWLKAASHCIDKCTKDNDDLLRLNRELSESRAKEAGSVNETATSSARFFNLGTFVEGIRARRMRFCEDNVGTFFVNKLENVKRWTKALDIKRLAKDIHHQGAISAYLLGQRVAELIKRRNKDRKMDESLLSNEQIKDYYRQYSPCPGILELTDRPHHRNFYDLATAPGNYERASNELKIWLDVIAVCRLIEGEPEQVFEDAATILYLHS